MPFRTLLTAVVFLATAATTIAQEVSQLKFHSEVLGQDRNLRIALPESYAEKPDRRYPVIVALDGEYVFYSALGAATILSAYQVMPEAIIVAIDQNYPVAGGRTARWTDCAYDSKTAKLRESGLKFRTFLVDELLPKVDRDYRTLPFRTLIGHSFTATYVHFFLFEEASPFQSCIALSPYLPEGLHAPLLDRLSHIERDTFYFASTGENDLDGHRKMLMQLDEKGLTKVQNPRLRLRFENYPQATHMSVVNRSMETALVHTFSAYSPVSQEEAKRDDFLAAPSAYLERKAADSERIYGIKTGIRERDLGMAQRAYIERKDWAKLGELGEFACETFPTKPIGEFLLGRSLAETGRVPEALVVYREGREKTKDPSDERMAFNKAIGDLEAASGKTPDKVTTEKGKSPAPANPAKTDAAASVPQFRYGAWGFDLTAMDRTVAPGKDFFLYANGGYFARNTFASDAHWMGTWEDRRMRTEANLRTLLESLPRNAPAGSPAQQVGDYYRTALDTDKIEQAGLSPLQPVLQAIASARSHEDVARLMARNDLQLPSPLRVSINVDERNPSAYAVLITSSGASGAPGTKERDAFLAHTSRLLALSGEKDPGAQANAILDLATKINACLLPLEKRRDRILNYNRRSLAELETLTPGYPWREVLKTKGLARQTDFVLSAEKSIADLSQLFLATPVGTWQSYLKYYLLVQNTDLLPKAFDEEVFSYHGKILRSRQSQPERWKRAVTATSNAMDEVLGRIYVDRYFPPESKQQMLAMVEELRGAFGRAIRNISWMSQPTKDEALRKLASFTVKIGYPDKWRDYSGLVIKPGDAIGNRQRVAQFDWDYEVARLGQPVDRTEMSQPPQSFEAYAALNRNEIVFPAGSLIPPFFDPQADPAVNYGSMCATIGHEIGHGFDDQGAKYDASGMLRNWWQPSDEAAFKAIGDRLAKQYDQYEVLPGIHVNGRLTLGENIADILGLKIAYDAYHASLNGREAPVIDGFTGDQRFFLGFAQMWRLRFRDEILPGFVRGDPHTPPHQRVNGVLRNLTEWYDAFGIKPTDPLYLPPEERIRVW